MNLKPLQLFSVLLCSLAFLQACTPKKQIHGYMPRASVIAALKPGQSSKADVVQLLGTPAFINSFADNRWHYVSFQTEQVGFIEPKIVKYDVLQLIFDEQHTLSTIRKGNKDTLIALTHDPKVTASSGREMTVIEQLIGNIGRFEEE